MEPEHMSIIQSLVNLMFSMDLEAKTEAKIRAMQYLQRERERGHDVQ